MAMEVRRRVPPPHGSAPRCQQATGGEGQRVRVQAGDTLPLPIRHTNLIFSELFAASLVYLMRRWQEKIRASTTLHVVSLAKIFAPPLYYTSRRILGLDAINTLPPPPVRSSQTAPPPARACPNYRLDLGAAGGAPSRGPRRQGGPEGGATEMRRDAVPPESRLEGGE
jgi:hypothetical protein